MRLRQRWIFGQRGFQLIAAFAEENILFAADSLFLQGPRQQVMHGSMGLSGGGLRQHLARNLRGILRCAKFHRQPVGATKAFHAVTAILLVGLAIIVDRDVIAVMLFPIHRRGKGFAGLGIGWLARLGRVRGVQTRTQRQQQKRHSKTSLECEDGVPEHAPLFANDRRTVRIKR